MKKKRLFFFLGIILILYAAYNIIMLQVSENGGSFENLVNQAGFAPLIAAEEEISTSDIDSTEKRPDRIIIPKINLDAPIVVAQAVTQEIDGEEYVQYLVPEKFAAGYHANSVSLGEIGNIVLSGHHNAYGEVFGNLYQLEEGDVINLYHGDELFQYVVTNVMIFEEKDQPLEVRLENARWILPSDDERLTLVTCWPQNSNSHRLIIAAVPLYRSQLANSEEICDNVENQNLFDLFFYKYMEAGFLSQNAFLQTTDYRLLIMKLSFIEDSVNNLDEHKCQPILKSNLVEFIQAVMLQVGFQQIGYEGEEFIKVEELIRSYQVLLESYFDPYSTSTREALLGSFQVDFHQIPNTVSDTLTASNFEDTSLNIRENAASNSRFLGSLPTGSSTTVIGKSIDGEWLLVPFKDALGWISLPYADLNISVDMIPVVLNQIINQD